MSSVTQQAEAQDQSLALTGRVKNTITEHWFSYLLFLPTLLFLVLLLWIPLIRGIWMSFHEWNLLGTKIWVGLGNYTYLFGWDAFYTSLRATILFSTTTILQLGLALVAALLIGNISRLKNVLSGVFLVPYTMPPVVTGTIWLYLLDPNFGPVFAYLIEWGILEDSIAWSIHGDMALGVITLVTAWTFWPLMFIIILASLESIPEEHYETAKVYGANRWQTFRHITLPQLKGAILVAVSIRLVWNLAKVSQPLQMTGGGPGYKTSILAILLYRFANEAGALGMAFAVGVILLILTLGFVVLFIRQFEKNRDQVRAT